MSLHLSAVVKTTLIGAAIGLVFGIVGGIPALTCMNCAFLPLGWLAPLGIGVVYVLFAASSGAAVRLGGGALGGAITGGITGGIVALASDVLGLVLGNTPDWLPEEAPSRQIGIVLTNCGLGVAGGILLGAILGAVGGLVCAAIKGRLRQH